MKKGKKLQHEFVFIEYYCYEADKHTKFYSPNKNKYICKYGFHTDKCSRTRNLHSVLNLERLNCLSLPNIHILIQPRSF